MVVMKISSAETGATRIQGDGIWRTAMHPALSRHHNLQCVSDLSLYEVHSAIVQRLCEALCYLQPAKSMA